MTTNPYEIERFNLDADARLSELYHEHVEGKVCPRCGFPVALEWTAMVVEVNCPECGWGKEVA